LAKYNFMGADHSTAGGGEGVAGSTHLNEEQLECIVVAFKEKSKNGKPVTCKGFIKIMKKVTAKHPSMDFSPERLSFYFSLFDVDHDGRSTTCPPPPQCGLSNSTSPEYQSR
jgi:hypothetical protein